MTPRDLAKVREMFPVGETVARLSCPNEQANKKILKQSPGSLAEPSEMQSTDEAKLNKTERAYLLYLRAIGYHWIGIQSITLKLADDCRYTPDLWTLGDLVNPIMARGQLVAREVKGFMRDDALVKIKVAARMFPFIVFMLVRKTSTGWDQQIVKP